MLQLSYYHHLGSEKIFSKKRSTGHIAHLRKYGEKFLNFVYVFSIHCNYLPLEKGVIIHLNKFKSPPLKDTLCQVWLKLTQ